MLPIHQVSNIINHSNPITSSITPSIKIPSIEFLTNQETQQLEKTLLPYKDSKYKYSCNKNILATLQLLPHELINKLKVIIATHEGNGTITYFKQSYGHHIFILGNTEHGLTMFDPIIPESTSIPAKNWSNAVYEAFPIQYALTNNFTLRFLPQYRIIEATHYIDQYDDTCKFIVRHPEHALKQKDEILSSELWKNSFSINLYEMNQLCLGNATYEETMSHHQDDKSPLTRLKDEQIAYLRAFNEK